MAFDIEIETKRHQEGWNGFVLFAMLGTAAVALTLALMALFLL